jgi:hypothetical protein
MANHGRDIEVSGSTNIADYDSKLPKKREAYTNWLYLANLQQENL